MYRVWAFLITALIIYVWVQAEYTAILKYYPDLTMWEYCMVGDKLRITPMGE